MRAGIAILTLAYMLSQFFRAFLAVLTPDLRADLGATAQDLSAATGLWFLTFAAMQVPVGAALDRVGPRATSAVLLAVGAGGGCALFAVATAPWMVTAAMMLIAVGCSSVLMAAYVIIARAYPPAVFATLASALVAIGSVGNVAGSLPMAWAVETFGWRQTMAGLGAFSAATALLIWLILRDPDRGPPGPKGSVLDILRIPALWPVFAMMTVAYAPVAGLRGIWAGPYLADLFGQDGTGIGRVTLVMGVAMITGSFLYGPMDRWMGTRKWVVFAGNLLCLTGLTCLALTAGQSLTGSTLLFALIGLTGTTYAVIVAHARAFFPAHLLGRGMTLINLFAIGGAGIMQLITGPVQAQGAALTGTQTGGYAILFAFYAVTMAAGLIIYLTAQDRTD
jgi:MFS family permease